MSIFKGLRRTKNLCALLLTCCVGVSTVSSVVFANEQVDDIKAQSFYAGLNGQPYGLYWFPEQLLNWSPDKTTIYNASSIPLANRIDKEKLVLSNNTQSKDFEVVAISIMNSSTSGNPAQGSNKFASNTYSYWQYIDKLVYWGGSSGEGIIVPPTPDVTDSAHRNGVPVLGTVFFPQEEHGGKIEWLNEVLDKSDNGTFPVADKLIEVARTLKFDGWFINQETQGANERDSQTMQEFIKYIKSKAPELEIMWYDSMTVEGEINWQNALNENNEMFMVDDNNQPVADSMFLNFWWNTQKYAGQKLLESSNNYAKNIGLNPYMLFAGIDVQAEGTKTPVRWHLLENGQTPYTSLGLYCPSWTYFSSNPDMAGVLSDTEQHDIADKFLEKESNLWVNSVSDPSKVGNDNWKGISTYAVEKSSVTSLPFSTNFSMGNGTSYFADGKKVSKQNWNNRSLNDIMPTYRWIIDNPTDNILSADIDYTDAYNGGNSILFTGNVSTLKPSTVKLYATDISIEENTKFSAVFKAKYEDTTKVDLVLDFYDGTNSVIKSDSKLTNEWTKLNYNLSQHVGKQIKSISFRISRIDDNPVYIKLGNISITNTQISPKQVNGIKVNGVYSEDGINAGIDITIDEAQSYNINRYEIYRKTSSGNQLVGATVNANYYIQDIKRNGKEDNTEFEVIAVDKNGSRSQGVPFEIRWDKYPVPKAEFSFDKTLVAPNEKVTFQSLSSETTESVEWEFEGANIQKSDKINPVVSYEKSGEYTVKLTAKNSSGDDTIVKENIITVSDKASQKTDNLALNKKAEASSFVNEKEAPEFAIDDSIKTKWCAVGEAPHEITIDLGEEVSVSEIDIYHAEAGGENADFNTKEYTIFTSLDGNEFTEVLKITNNKKGISKDPIKVSKAKYVKISIDKPTQGGDTAARIYDIKVVGIR